MAGDGEVSRRRVGSGGGTRVVLGQEPLAGRGKMLKTTHVLRPNQHLAG
jgi:hypothetical protein